MFDVAAMFSMLRNIVLRAFAPSRWVALLLLSYVVPAGAAVLTLDEGVRAYERKDYGRAEEVFRERTVGDPKDSRSLYNLGNALYRQDRYDEAAQSYSEALKADPRLAAGWYNLGNALYRQDRFRDAVQAYSQALKLDPKDEDARYNLGLAQKRAQEDPKKDRSDPKGMPTPPPDPKQEPQKGEQKEKSDQGPKQEGGDRKQGDRTDAASKKEQPDPKSQEQGRQTSDDQRRRQEGAARREQARKDLGMNDQQVRQLLDNMEKQEKQLQPYFQPNPKRAARRNDVFDMLPREQAEMMRRFFGRQFQGQGETGAPVEDW